MFYWWLFVGLMLIMCGLGAVYWVGSWGGNRADD